MDTVSQLPNFEYQYNTVPREKKLAWGEGPWVDEPDKAQWTDKTTGLPCLLVRNRLGALCGYVGVYPTHPYHGKHDGTCEHPECLAAKQAKMEEKRAELATMPEEDAKWAKMVLSMDELMLRRGAVASYDCPHVASYAVAVHGGITFSAFCMDEGNQAENICHVPKPDEPTVWWLGFDCAHAWDLTPGMDYELKKITKEVSLSCREESVYRDVAYVVRECTKLATQLAQIEAVAPTS